MSKKIILMIVGLLLVGGLGAGGYLFFTKDKKAETAAHTEEKKKEEEEIDYEHADATQVLIEEDTYSLSAQDQYAKMAIAIRVAAEEDATKLTYHLPEVKADMIKEFSKLTTSQLRGAEGFDFTEKTLKSIIEKYLTKDQYKSLSVTSLKLQN